MGKVITEVSQYKNGQWENPVPVATTAQHVYLITNTGEQISLQEFFGIFKKSAIGCGVNLDNITEIVAKAYVDQQLNALSDALTALTQRVTALEGSTP